MERQRTADGWAPSGTPFTTDAGRPRPRLEVADARPPRPDVQVSRGDGGRCQALHGRREERAALDGLLEAVRGGESRALVLRGEPGAGKTALLDHLGGRAHGFDVSRVAGVQSELDLAFAGLHRLCVPLSEHLPRLPGPQREALRSALGLSTGPAPDLFLLGLAVLGLLSEAARNRPQLCLVDDAQWLDRDTLTVLTFTARRLRTGSVAIVFGTREPDPAPEPAGPADPATALTGLPETVVAGLPAGDARALLRTAVPGPWDEDVLERLVDETRGNPGALLELVTGASPAELAGGFGPPGSRAFSGPIQDIYRRRVVRLGLPTRRLLLVAAAEPGGDPALLWRAADRLGIPIDAAAPAVTAGLLRIGDRVRFHHPLVRSAAYWTASPDERRRAHGVLAGITDPDAAPDRRAWHAAQAAPAPAEDVAAGLERAAVRARARGGAAAAAAFLARAAELTPDPVRRQDRALAAAHATHRAGTDRAALRLLSIAEAGPLDRHRRGRADLLRARIACTTRRDGDGDAAALLLEAARRLPPEDVPLVRDAYLEAIGAAMSAGRTGRREAAAATRSAPPARRPPRPADLLLDGMTRCLTGGLAAGAGALRAAVDAFGAPDLPDEDALRWARPAGLTAATLWDHAAWDAFTSRHVRLARDAGRAAELPLALTSRIVAKVVAGELDAAAALAAEVETVSRALGEPSPPYGALVLAAWQGREADAAALAGSVAAEAARRGAGAGSTVGRWAAAVLCNGLGRYRDVPAMPADADDRPGDVAAEAWLLPEYVEAAVRRGDAPAAEAALRRLGEVARTVRTDWVLGLHARSQALARDDADADGRYREAIDRLGRTPVRGELARAHLLYGEWLRRRRHRRAAREQLRTAHAAFTAMGMDAFARRAARELLATGEHVRGRTAPAGGELTAQEAQIVRLVKEGLTNPEIGTRLFISPRTVEWHLRKIFAKLGVTSRKQLRRPPSPADG
ncbi:AAA family ATPase [Actinomadura sp. LOL_016]|uniref:helix-turn-helix transcriptional regulator n=1 Tax=Actinomadura sp. LOL_016 TaxID=3345411 RepID=UPI003A8B49F2